MRTKKLLLLFPVLVCFYLSYRTFFPSLLERSLIALAHESNGSIFAESFCAPGEVVYGNFCVFSPYENKNAHEGAIVSLTTQGTVEFLHHVIVLCRRWSGPISVAVYSPPEDYIVARFLVNNLRDCDFCIRHWVSWHFFYGMGTVPNYYNTEYIGDCTSITQGRRPKKRRSHDTYPINLGRNLARSRTVTPYVFPIDIELYPSIGTLPKFERMIRQFDNSEGFHVWVLPVFEVHSKYSAPTTKADLRTMYAKKQAISFHRYRCDICHRIPNLTQWLDYGGRTNSAENEILEPLRMWSTVKRNKKFRLNFWEPFFIGTRDDPEFDIRLSWEGKQNKMQMAYEMCLMDYNFHIVENAFLVHAPGINVYNASKEKFRQKYVLKNNKLISAIKKDLQQKYGSKKNC